MTRKKGYLGEAIALSYLLQVGYRQLETNFYSQFGEIDLIVVDPDQTCVFVEVKYYRKASFLRPEEAIHYKKQQALIATALHYFAVHPKMAENQSRFDLIVVQDAAVASHLKNLFSVGD